MPEKNSSKLPLIIFIITILLGLSSLIFTYFFRATIPGFYVGEVYPSSNPGCDNPDALGCCDDHTDSTPKPSTTSPSPSSTSSFSCTGLTPQPSPVNAGDQLTFTCQGTSQNTSLISINFRVLDKNGATINTQTKDLTSAQTSAEFIFTVPGTADVAPFRAQCQVCKTGGTCTAWGQVN